jgi:hypothetical protein
MAACMKLRLFTATFPFLIRGWGGEFGERGNVEGNVEQFAYTGRGCLSACISAGSQGAGLLVAM